MLLAPDADTNVCFSTKQLPMITYSERFTTSTEKISDVPGKSLRTTLDFATTSLSWGKGGREVIGEKGLIHLERFLDSESHKVCSPPHRVNFY